MIFKTLKLKGFKSFLEATELSIEHGLTGIVGPNGCGKSNLVEALRFVMGELSPKQMRGSELDDVIFNGTTSRPAWDIAEVTIELDNKDRKAPNLFNDSDNIEVIASLSEIYSHRGENKEAIELIDSALEQDSTSLIVKLIKMKLMAKKEKNSNEYIRGLDDIIHFLVTDERFQIYKNTATDPDIIWLYESSDEKEVLIA